MGGSFMILFSLLCIGAFYLLTQQDTVRFKKIAWPVYGVIALTSIIGLLFLQADTTTYVLWVRLFFLLLLIPIFTLVIRKIWMMSQSTPLWVQYSVSIPVSLLFILTLWICYNMFPILIYIF
jgi:hypothetical protein